ncbi:MAG: glycosyltransferase family 4 protein [Steroidobacteraceae bacterium]
MKILYHHRTASRDGQSTHIEEMVKAMRSLGHTVEIVAPAVDDSDQTGGSGGWAGQLKRLLPKPVYEFLELVYSVVAYRRLARAIKAFKPDFIYERYNLFLLAGAWARKRFGVPLVLEVNAPMALERRQYGGLSLGWLADWAEHFVWRSADTVLPVSQVLADHIQGTGVPAERLVVVPNGINPEDYANLPSREEAKARLGLSGRLVIGFTGFVREWDRLDRVVAWLARYDGPQRLHLLVVGDGPARVEIESCAAACGISDRVSFTGVISRGQVPAAASAFDVALQTALVPYASPLCLFEYLALGIATVAPDQPNHHEIVTGDSSAVLYEPEDPTGLERAIEKLCRDADFRQAIARAGQQLIAEKHLTWQEHARHVVQLATALVKR